MTKTKKAYIPSKIELEGLLSITKEDSIQRWAMLHFSYFAGLRSMEIASLSIEDIFQGNELKGMAQLPTKGGGTRRITLVDKKLRSAISTFYEVQNLSAKPMTAPLFTNPSGGRFTPNAVVKQFVKMYQKANLPCSSHSGRRYFATKLGNTPGITTRQMMALGGWSEPNVAMQYIETNEEQLDDLVGRASL
jgi:site-specific recombinase XerD|tara:strand:- start:605 stop:1177 length:573 start_codon:yes stop_codon:yes gene_type:complete